MSARTASLLAAGVLSAFCSTPALALDNDSYCDVDGANVVLYLDVTTPYDDIDKRALVDGIGHIFEGLEGGDRFSIRTIEDAFPKSARLIDACVPFCAGGMLGDFFSQCTEGAVINDTKVLRRQIVESLAGRLSSSTELLQSELIRTLALSAPEEFREGKSNEIYVFSDMIENSPYLSGADFFASDNQELVLRLADDKLIPNLLDAKVGVFGMGRGGGEGRAALPQDRLTKLEEFWRLFFIAAGAEATLRQNFSFSD
jgi:hypothetical protein